MDTAAPLFDINRKFVRVLETRTDGFIVFEFAVGQADVCAEMILPICGFIDFCTAQKVQFLPKHKANHEHTISDGLEWQLSDVQKNINTTKL